ncbi:hypothetical protein ACHAW5_008359 [Stephanodiscus triporus]|uniref:Ribosomal RNA-processing protein 42 n=1 Tax=Stephanodiscus triporus TaxID=2934178 RepID=A0ABD3Q9X1_9STRA
MVSSSEARLHNRILPRRLPSTDDPVRISSVIHLQQQQQQASIVVAFVQEERRRRGERHDDAQRPRRRPLVLSNGSSRVHLPGSSTDVLCSVKADLIRPSSSRRDAGVCELCVDLSLAESEEAEDRRADGGAQRATRRRMSRIIRGGPSRSRRLAGRCVWRLSIDVVVIRADGCVLDACSVAIRAALIDARLPRVVPLVDGDAAASSGVVGGGGNDDDGGTTETTIGYGELFPGGGGEGGGKGDLLVDGDYGRARPPPGAGNVRRRFPRLPPSSSSSAADAAPAATTTRQCRSVPIIDDRAERRYAPRRGGVCVSVDPDGVVCGVHTLGGGGAGEEEVGFPAVGDVGRRGDIRGDGVEEAVLRLLRNDDGGKGEGRTSDSWCWNNEEGEDGEDTVDDDGGCYGYLLKDHFLIR